jgi:hypothetical protein
MGIGNIKSTPLRRILIVAICALVPLAFVSVAGLLAFHGRDGWGWFLIAAALVAGSTHVKVD